MQGPEQGQDEACVPLTAGGGGGNRETAEEAATMACADEGEQDPGVRSVGTERGGQVLNTW